MAKRTPSRKPTQTAAAVTSPEQINMPTTNQGEISIPRDQVRFSCPKHGDITNATLHLSFADQEGKKQGQFLYCMHCLNEVLLSLQKAKAIETVQIVIPDEIAQQMGAVKKDIPEASTDAQADPTAALRALADMQGKS